MSERVVQALIRLVRIFLVAGLSALGLAIPDATNDLFSDNPMIAALVIGAVPAVIEFLLKLVGGPTTPQPQPIEGARGGSAATAPRPPFGAV